ncbi:Na-translocating system protein MpsC family protein, partial [Priestia megaterium]
HNVSSYLLDQRTLLIIREGIMVTIEKELVQLGFEENLTLAKRNLEKRLLYEHSQSLEVILDSKVTDILVAWDFHKDKSTILLILNPTS